MTDNSYFCLSAETFEVDISITKRLIEGERGQRIRDKGIMVSALFTIHVNSLKHICYLCIISLTSFLFSILQVVGESGLFTPDDIAFVQEAGVRAVSFKFFFFVFCLQQVESGGNLNPGSLHGKTRWCH